MPKCVLTVGISASGKTTWAEQQNIPILCRDDIRKDLLVITGVMMSCDNLWRHYDFKKYEGEIQKHWDIQFLYYTSRDRDFIIADTNLNPKYRLPLIDKLQKAGYDVEVKEFPISFEEAVKRDLKRRDSVGKDVIYKQWQQWVQYLVDTGQKKRYVPDTSKPSAIICDIDGTLAHMQGRGPHDLSKVGDDLPDTTVSEILEHFADLRYRIILVSGREGVCRADTGEWLYRWKISYHDLFMRDEGDYRKDSIIKEEIFWGCIADHYNVRFVIDDRPSVCRMWMDLGLKVFNVGNPYVEF